MGKVVLEARDNLEKGGTLSEPLEKLAISTACYTNDINW